MLCPLDSLHNIEPSFQLEKKTFVFHEYGFASEPIPPILSSHLSSYCMGLGRSDIGILITFE